MTQPWFVRVWMGHGALANSVTYELTEASTDPAGYGLLDGLTIKAALPDSDMAPLDQPEPREATWSWLAHSTRDYDQLQLGMPVKVAYYPASSGPQTNGWGMFWLAGRLAALSVKPHRLGVIYTATAVSYVADLGELTVGDTAYPAEDVLARVTRILADAGYPAPVWKPADGAPAPDPAQNAAPTGAVVELAARPASATDAWTLLTHTLAQFPAQYAAGGTPRRIVVAPNIPDLEGVPGGDWVPDPAAPWKLTPTYPTGSVGALGSVHTVAGLLSVYVDPAYDGAYGKVVSAARTAFDTTLTQSKAQAINQVVASGAAFGTRKASTGQLPRVALQLDQLDLTDGNDAKLLASMYLPADQPTTTMLWTADSFTWLLYAEPGTNWGRPKLGELCAIANVPNADNPLDREWLLGIITAWTLQLSGGRPTVELRLAPALWTPEPAANSAGPRLTWNSAKLAGVTWNQLNPRDTWNDYRMVN